MRLLENWREGVLKNRPQAKIDPYSATPMAPSRQPGGDLAKAALNAGLVDKLG